MSLIDLEMERESGYDVKTVLLFFQVHRSERLLGGRTAKLPTKKYGGEANSIWGVTDDIHQAVPPPPPV